MGLYRLHYLLVRNPLAPEDPSGGRFAGPSCLRHSRPRRERSSAPLYE